MAKHQREYYTCDCCGAEIEYPVRGSERGPTGFQIFASVDHGVSGYQAICWKDLCESCNSAAGTFINNMMGHQKASRK